MAKDLYKILGVKRDATGKEIKKAFRKLARKFHPDVNPGDKVAERKFKELSDAYNLLSNPKKRAQYDQFGSEYFSRNQHGNPGRTNPFEGIDFDFFGRNDTRQSQGNFKDFFRDIFNQRGSMDSGPRAGTDLNYNLTISFNDAYLGITNEVRLKTDYSCSECAGTGVQPGSGQHVCPDCNGTGQTQTASGPFKVSQICGRCGGSGSIGQVCSTCNGTGVISGTQTIQVKIPAGVDTGSRVRVSGKGNPGIRGGHSGDLYINIRVTKHPFFKRSGNNIIINIPISVSESILGARILVPTPDGSVKMTIPPGCDVAKMYRIAGKGFPVLRGGKRGDIMVNVKIVSPGYIPDNAKDLVREFARIVPHNPREGMFNIG
ncbi:molecular chaperone DnaJ [bacterium]|nr:molecular chaperone DnaJ [bacterium]